MQEFITLDMLANYTIFITIVAAATQLIKRTNRHFDNEDIRTNLFD